MGSDNMHEESHLIILTTNPWSFILDVGKLLLVTAYWACINLLSFTTENTNSKIASMLTPKTNLEVFTIAKTDTRTGNIVNVSLLPHRIITES